MPSLAFNIDLKQGKHLAGNIVGTVTISGTKNRLKMSSSIGEVISTPKNKSMRLYAGWCSQGSV